MLNKKTSFHRFFVLSVFYTENYENLSSGLSLFPKDHKKDLGHKKAFKIMEPKRCKI